MPTAPFLAPERDEAFKDGRPKSVASFYSLPGVSVSTVNTISPNTGSDYYYPYWVRTPIIVDQLALEVTSTSAGNVRVGLYVADADLQPIGAPLADSGDISTATTGEKTYTPSTPIYLRRGRYLGVLNCSATPIFRCFRGGGGLRTGLGVSPIVSEIYVSRAYAAFPTPGTAWNTTTGNAVGFNYVPVLRVLVP